MLFLLLPEGAPTDVGSIDEAKEIEEGNGGDNV